jgi:antitoxin ParD1/3/4
MNVSLTPELEKLVNEKVASGRYQTASEVIREGLRLLQERDHLHQAKLKKLRQELAVGAEEIKQGRVKKLDPEEMKDRVKRALAERPKRKHA